MGYPVYIDNNIEPFYDVMSDPVRSARFWQREAAFQYKQARINMGAYPDIYNNIINAHMRKAAKYSEFARMLMGIEPGK